MCLATALYHFLQRPKHPTSSKPLQRPTPKHIILLSLAILFSLTFYHLYTTTLAYTLFQTAAPDLPLCSNAIVFTGARQGSTWFINSLERCSFADAPSANTSQPRFADDSFKRTELWKHFGEPALDGTNLSATDAVHYIVHNNSVKIFPSVFWRRRDDIAQMLRMRREHNLTVLVLRRDVHAAWDSWRRANRSGVWNGSVKQVHDEYDPQLHEYFLASRERYDRGVENFLHKEQVPYDVFDYDQVKGQPYVIAKNNHCYIANCNFIPLSKVAGFVEIIRRQQPMADEQ